MNFKKNVLKTIAILSLSMFNTLGVYNHTASAEELSNGNWEIKRGDTLSDISLQIGISVETICSYNTDIDPLTLPIGYELRLKQGAAELAKEQQEQAQKIEAAQKAEQAVKAAAAEAVAAVEAASEVVAPEPAAPAVPEEAPATLIGSFEATYYTAFDGTQIGITANGTDVRNGQTMTSEGYRIIAADPSVLPLNTIVRITTGNGESFIAQVCDTGGAIQGSRIDILVGSLGEATQLGRTTAEISQL